MNNNRELIVKEIEGDLKLLNQLTPSDDGYSKVVDNVIKLYELVSEDDRKTIDRKDRNLHSMIEHGLEASSIVLPLIFYGVWMRRGFKFEENGVFSSATFRGLFQKFKPTKL